MSRSSLQHISKEIHDKAPVGPITTSNWTTYITLAIEAVSTVNNIIFYSNNQIPIFLKDDSTYMKVWITGEYGSGKTLILREKAEILALKGEKVLFIIGTRYDDKDALLQISLRERWKDKKYNGNIKVLNTNDFQVCVSDLTVLFERRVVAM